MHTSTRGAGHVRMCTRRPPTGSNRGRGSSPRRPRCRAASREFVSRAPVGRRIAISVGVQKSQYWSVCRRGGQMRSGGKTDARRKGQKRGKQGGGERRRQRSARMRFIHRAGGRASRNCSCNDRGVERVVCACMYVSAIADVPCAHHTFVEYGNCSARL